MNKEEIIKRLLQKSICVNTGMDGCYSPYSTDEEWYNDIDNLVNICEVLEQQSKKYKEVIDMFLDKVDKNKMLLNNPDLLDLYLKIKEVE